MNGDALKERGARFAHILDRAEWVLNIARLRYRRTERRLNVRALYSDKLHI